MPTNIWRADYGYCEVPTPVISMPLCHQLPPVSIQPPLMMYTPPPILYKAEKPHKEKKGKVRTVYVPVAPAPMPIHHHPTPTAGPAPYPPLPGQPTPAVRREKGVRGGSDDGYEPIRYSGGMIKLHILPKYSKAEAVTDGRVHVLRHTARSYMDCLSFRQFVKDFAGKGDWVVTQIRERGAGRWEKAIVVDTSKDAGGQSMADVGWKADNGPVWVVLEHRREGA